MECHSLYRKRFFQKDVFWQDCLKITFDVLQGSQPWFDADPCCSKELLRTSQWNSRNIAFFAHRRQLYYKAVHITLFIKVTLCVNDAYPWSFSLKVFPTAETFKKMCFLRSVVKLVINYTSCLACLIFFSGITPLSTRDAPNIQLVFGILHIKSELNVSAVTWNGCTWILLH